MPATRPRRRNSSWCSARPQILTPTSRSRRANSAHIQRARMPYETLLTDLSDNIFTITINRPDKLNALNTAMIHEFIDAIDVADKDDAARAIIVTGAGRAFCAGADLSTGAKTFDREARADRPQVPNGPDGKPDLRHENSRDGGGRMTLRIFNCRKPVIGAVNGPAVGIGATVLLPMDVRIA